MNEIPIRMKLWRLFCYHGADEGDSEPYMWVIAFKFDGSTVTQQLASLNWTPDFFFSPGSHGCLGSGGVIPGTKIGIPAAVGTWETTLKPITLTDANGATASVPGAIAFLAVVLEENNVPAHAAEAGHQALNNFVAGTLASFVTGINLFQFNASVQQRMASGISRTQAIQDEFMARIEVLRQSITNAANSVVETAMREAMSLPELVWTAIDKDQVMGRSFHFMTAQQLVNESDFTLDFTDPMFDNPDLPEAGDWGYNLHSLVKAKVRWKAIPSQLPAAHEIQIQGILKGYSRELRSYYISDVGGVVDGKYWRLRRSEACSMIRDGAKSFFLQDANGIRTPVQVEFPPDSYWGYLYTPSDSSTANNLLSLPKLYEIPGYVTRELEADPFG